MSRTGKQLIIDLATILECVSGDIMIKEDFESCTLHVGVNREALSDSMFDVDQFQHIVDSLTPRLTRVRVEEFTPDLFDGTEASWRIFTEEVDTDG